MFDTKLKNFITWTLDFENWHKKSGFVRTQQTLILVDPVDDEDLRPQTDPPNDAI